MALTRIHGSTAEYLLAKKQNLADLTDASVARDNLDVPTYPPSDDEVYGLKNRKWIPVNPGLAELEQKVSDNKQYIAGNRADIDALAAKQPFKQFLFKTQIDKTNPADDRFFGRHIALSADGQWLAIGASDENNSSGSNAGGVYLYKRTPSHFWQEIAHIKGKRKDGRLGYTVALSQDGVWLATGSPKEKSDTNQSGGAVILYKRQEDNSYVRQAALGYSDNQLGLMVQEFGTQIALNSDATLLAVGAWSSDLNGGNRGVVVCFSRDGEDNWTAATPVYGDSAESRAGYGLALSRDGKRLAVGSPYKKNGSKQQVGAVKVYDVDGGGNLTVYRNLQPAELTANCYYGHAVSLNGDGTVLGVAIRDYDISKGSNESALMVHTFGSETFDDNQQIIFSPMPYGDNNRFGDNVIVSADGKTLIAGDEYACYASGFCRTPSVYIWQRDGDTYYFSQTINPVGTYNNSNGNYPAFGRVMALSGDTLAVGAPEARTVVANQGYVHIFERNQ